MPESGSDSIRHRASEYILGGISFSEPMNLTKPVVCYCGETATVLMRGRGFCSKHALATLTVPPDVTRGPLDPQDGAQDEGVQ